jgi:hypothetical protein
MKLLIHITIAFFILLTFPCYGQKRNASLITKDDTIKEIIDPVENMPFSIERDSVYASLPDTLGGNQRGFAVIGLLINEKSIIEDVFVIRLFLKENEIETIDYTQGLPNQEHKVIIPKQIQRYKQFFVEYAKKIRIKKNSKNAPKMTRMNLMVRFR